MKSLNTLSSEPLHAAYKQLLTSKLNFNTECHNVARAPPRSLDWTIEQLMQFILRPTMKLVVNATMQLTLSPTMQLKVKCWNL